MKSVNHWKNVTLLKEVGKRYICHTFKKITQQLRKTLAFTTKYDSSKDFSKKHQAEIEFFHHVAALFPICARSHSHAVTSPKSPP